MDIHSRSISPPQQSTAQSAGLSSPRITTTEELKVGQTAQQILIQKADTTAKRLSEISVNTPNVHKSVGIQTEEIEHNHHTIIPFGTLLGNSNGVIARSNGTTARISNQPNEDKNGVYCGMKWQCVEYGRRYLHEVKGFTFEGVHGAHNIWDLDTLTELKTSVTHEFLSNKNGRSKDKPLEGALLIYPMQDDCPFGHVAAIVDVKFDETTGKGYVRIGEQNWANTSWEGNDYSRELELKRDEKGRYTIIDDSGHPILGWKAIGEVITEE